MTLSRARPLSRLGRRIRVLRRGIAESLFSRDSQSLCDHRTRTMNIAIVTMVYNEKVNLPVWIRHYRRTAPSAALFVVDHASDDGSTQDLPGATRIPLPRDEMDEWSRTRLINHLQRALLQYYDVFIYTDCDELIVPDPNVSGSLESHLATRDYSHASPVGLEVIHLVDEESPIDLTRPLLTQRRFCRFHANICKPLITRVALNWEPGFHYCDQPLNLDRDLYLFHTKSLDRDCALERQRIARNVRWSRAALEAHHGAHHRYDDKQFEREFFLDPMNQYRQGGVRPFQFDTEIARLQAETVDHAGVFGAADFTGPLVEIPHRFKDAF